MDYQANARRIQQVMSQIPFTVPTVKLESSLNFAEWYENFTSDTLQLDADIYNFITDDDWQPPLDAAGWADYRSFLDSKIFVLLRFYVERHVWADISLVLNSSFIILILHVYLIIYDKLMITLRENKTGKSWKMLSYL